MRALEAVRSFVCYPHFNVKILSSPAGVKGFANFAVGVDNLDVPETIRRRIPLSNTPDIGPDRPVKEDRPDARRPCADRDDAFGFQGSSFGKI